MELCQGRTHRHAELRVEVRERLVHQERLRLADDRAAHRDALPLPSGELRGLPVEQLAEPEEAGHLVDPPPRLALAHPPHLEPVTEVLADRHVRIEGVVLEDHRDVAMTRREVGHVGAGDSDGSRGDLLEAGDHPQERRLAAARRPHEDDELAVRDLDADVVDGLEAVAVDLRDPVDLDRRHAYRAIRIVDFRTLIRTTSRRSIAYWS